ncbi:energy transducer TonB [Bowmanella sp. JS7-9]|uniref:Protein TonB n=1 Tax=Pseudobowmanella zhangzhouensis TaxID=1537679 RepID=A0ABW1XKN0_9ALTE|nr:energy transducer TonB [Bowmanella sp. JS7-9]
MMQSLQRIVVALVLAGAVTLGLFYLMQSLIKSGDTQMKEPPAGRVLDFVRVKPEETVKQKENKPQKPPKPQEPPPQMEAPQLDNPNPEASASSTTFTASVDTGMGLEGGPSLESSDGDYLPIVRQPAVYPRMAQSRGIEGWVIVEFTVTKNGSVRDPSVLQAEPQGIFERSAMDAVLKYKYKPRVVNGEATEVGGVTVKVTFEL